MSSQSSNHYSATIVLSFAHYFPTTKSQVRVASQLAPPWARASASVSIAVGLRANKKRFLVARQSVRVKETVPAPITHPHHPRGLAIRS